MSLRRAVSPDTLATATLSVSTRGQGLVEITADLHNFIDTAEAGDGLLFLFLRHTSASLLIQENAAPEVRTDLKSALDRLAPDDAGWQHQSEGPDDMPAHVKAMLTGVSLHLPVIDGRLALGTWQGVYLAEHRSRPHRRELVVQFLGSRRTGAGTPARSRR